MLTFVAAVEDVWESVGAFEVEKRGDRENQEQADQQCSQKKRGSNTGPSCTKKGNNAKHCTHLLFSVYMIVIKLVH